MRPETEALLDAMLRREASDIYLTFDSPPALRIRDDVEFFGEAKLTDADLQAYMADLLSDEQIDEYRSTLELNTALNWGSTARFRINVYKQQQHPALVIRHIRTTIPTLESLGLPEIYKTIMLQKRGLILVVGQTGCGKSTSLAAMIGHRNRHGKGHIITIEDPIEFVHGHDKCIISQRDVGIDTYSFGMALKNTLRQHPDVILIGEIRDRETMEHAIVFSETGHLCLATLHSNNSSQAIERIINFFPEEMHKQVLLNLSANLRGILSQRLITTLDDQVLPVTEIMLNEGYIRDLILEGRIREMREMMAKSRDRGMQTFDQGLITMFEEGKISEATAIGESDNASNQRLAIKQLTIDRQPYASAINSNIETMRRDESDF